MPTSQDEAILRAIRGDREALATLLESTGPTVRRAMAGQIPERWQSVLSEDDVMQQTYADAFQNIRHFTPLGDGAFRAWLSSLAECNLRDALRMLGADKRGGNRRRVEAIRSDGSYVELYNLLSDSGTSPSRHVGRDEARDEMEQAIENLPETYRRVVRLYDLDERPAKQIAESIGRSVGAVYMLRSRAHDLLRAAMGASSKFFTDFA
ncbi:MAG: sigma-70 family RNA polymerase sigma factor [Phycisphaerae bacterium]